MSEINLNARFAPKSDTAANWASNNIVLLMGEVGVETDTNKMKVGDGETAWNDLPYREIFTTAEKAFINQMKSYTFTPTLIGISSNTLEYLEQSGTYSITGNMVQSQFYIRANVEGITKTEDVLGIKLNSAPVKSVTDTSFMGNFSIAGFGNISNVYAIMQSNTNIVSLTVKATDYSSTPSEYFTNLTVEDIEEDIIEIWGSATYIFDTI